MSHTTDKRLEHQEHTQHHAQDPFDRKVAMTMTIMAAILAGVTVVSHRAHTETLRLATESSTFQTQAANQWALYQAKNIRNHEYQAFLVLEQLLAKDGVRQDADAKAMRGFWIGQVDKYEGKGFWTRFSEGLVQGSKKPATDESTGELAKLRKDAEKLHKEAESKEHQSHELHGLATWIDLGHLGLELALVFCAVAVLTKQRSFWLTGVLFATVGSALAAYGGFAWMMLGQGHH